MRRPPRHLNPLMRRPLSTMRRPAGIIGRAAHREATRAVLLVPLALSIIALGGCGSSASSTGSHTSAAGTGSSAAAAMHAGPAGTIHIVMKNIAFNPGTIHARVGQTVTWTDQDDAPHNVTYASGPRFNSSPTITNGESWTLTLNQAGVIHYLCTIHPGMSGVIVVTH